MQAELQLLQDIVGEEFNFFRRVSHFAESTATITDGEKMKKEKEKKNKSDLLQRTFK